jgi:hypothetical protein
MGRDHLLPELYDFEPMPFPIVESSREGVLMWYKELEARRLAVTNYVGSESGASDSESGRGSSEGSSEDTAALSKEESVPQNSSDVILKRSSTQHSQVNVERRHSLTSLSSLDSALNSAEEGKAEGATSQVFGEEAIELADDESSHEVEKISKSDEDEMDDNPRRTWWERLKAMYVNAYQLMFEEGVIYFEHEQEAALWRVQLLMFFFALQSLFEVSFEGRNGLEKVLQNVCPPFAKLPLVPPKGLEATGALIRGICERAQFAGNTAVSRAKRHVAVEAGVFQENARDAFTSQMFETTDLRSVRRKWRRRGHVRGVCPWA